MKPTQHAMSQADQKKATPSTKLHYENGATRLYLPHVVHVIQPVLALRSRSPKLGMVK